MLSGRQQQQQQADAAPARLGAASLCRREPALPAVLLEARGRALDGCRAAFRYDRWNCSLSIAGQSVFAKQFRETAALQAVSGAALADAVSRACARGQLRRCGCPATADSRRLLRESGTCPEGAVAAAGRRLARRFLLPAGAATEPADARETVLRHNLAVGMQVVEEQLEETCRCHGVSGSCAAKTCWRRLAPFPRTADALRRRYLSARLLLVPNSHRDLRRAHRTLEKQSSLAFPPMTATPQLVTPALITSGACPQSLLGSALPGGALRWQSTQYVSTTTSSKLLTEPSMSVSAEDVREFYENEELSSDMETNTKGERRD
ncbi:protein Wnt-4-like [Schistocerca nitens]|uniref:protein Wnt-4-like n=1 Tax=Schistocerca nitens TaxID=7011 RepID=UPI0021172F5C|nr:protein Wnt-4-like [Schistocerca nitens]